jgi:hypothetical protein
MDDLAKAVTNHILTHIFARAKPPQLDSQSCRPVCGTEIVAIRHPNGASVRQVKVLCGSAEAQLPQLAAMLHCCRKGCEGDPQCLCLYARGVKARGGVRTKASHPVVLLKTLRSLADGRCRRCAPTNDINPVTASQTVRSPKSCAE